MPIYEYVCGACGNEFEEWQKISDPPVSKCPKCGKKKVEKKISLSAFHLKGGGWYKDLYSSNGKSSSKSETKSESKSESKSETKSESKSETKSESKSSDSKPAKAAAK